MANNEVYQPTVNLYFMKKNMFLADFGEGDSGDEQALDTPK